MKELLMNVGKCFNKKKWLACTYNFGNGHAFDDWDIYKMTKQHMRFIDTFSMFKIISASQLAFNVLCGSMEMPEEKKWKLY